MSGTSAELKDAIRHILTESQNKTRFSATEAMAEQRPATAVIGGNPDDRFRSMRERIAVLEDVLVKSEADRAAVYQRCDAATRALEIANEERMAYAHNMQDRGLQSAAAAELAQAHQEITSLTEQVMMLSEQLNESQHRQRDLESQVKAMKKEKKRMMAETDGVSLADLHYSNERLSAQLLQLQRQQAAQESQSKEKESSRIAQLDAATRSLVEELTALEQKFAVANATHEQERARLQAQLDQQFHEFSLERAECDSIVGALGAKIEAYGFRIEALMTENAALKNQLASSGGSSAVQASLSGGRVKR